MKNTLILWFYQKDPLNSERYKNKNFTKSEDVTRATLMTPAMTLNGECDVPFTNEATSCPVCLFYTDFNTVPIKPWVMHQII